jgi:carboxypeptidase Q
MRIALLLLFVSLVPAAERIDSDANAKLRQEAKDHSQVMQIVHKLTDRYGPRLTGSPNYKAAADWALSQFKEWGLVNAHLEPWEFGHPGWVNKRATGFITAPVHDTLVLEVLAWTPSTKGPVAAEALLMVPPDKPTKEDLSAWLEANKDKVKGRIVLIGKPAEIKVSFSPRPLRMTDEAAKARFDPNNPRPMRFPERPKPEPGRLTPAQINEMIDPWLVANGALVRVNDAALDHGQIRAFQNRTYDVAKAVPTVILRNEDYGRIARLLADGEKVRLEFNVLNHIYPEGHTTYNVVAEIPGADKAAEVVMLGGHLDSWHAATGATDNAIGSSVMMEAVRMIQALGLKPRRTIRIALWSAEEEGLLGSKEYVKEHYGTFEEPKPDFSKFVAYFNVDSGTGRIRGASIFGPPEAATVLREILAPFADLGVAGAIATTSRRTGGTDSTSFNAAGLAGVGLGQDPIEYMSVTWHTNLDTYERIVPEDAVSASLVVASAVWHVATRDEPLPTFPKEKMPAPPGSETTP